MRSIWQLGMSFRRSAGGADRYFGDLLEALHGESLYAAAFDDPESQGEIGRRISLGSSKAPLLRRRKEVRAFGRRMAAEPGNKLMATHFALYAAFLPAEALRVPQVVHFHGPWCDESRAEGGGVLGSMAKWLVERRVYRRATRCVALSQAFGEILENRFGVSRSRIDVVPGTVDERRFSPGLREAARERLGLPRGGRAILCVRRMVRRVGVSELIQAFARVAMHWPDVVLHLVGRGPMEESFRRQVMAAGIGTQVMFHGYVADEDLPDFYRAADLSIVPSQALEGFGLVCLESLACGVPVMVAPVGGLPEVVDGLDRRLVLDASTVDAIGNGLKRWLDGTYELPSAERCVEHVARHFSRQIFAKRVLDVYSKAMS